ncbi:MAG: hypothetical protein M0R51_14240 [Clostridia bacterium]|jgi:uncharacterized coiled-coil DUF342 family protein|nr:hypothetical protein [Clostridia bacterium]
MQLFKLGMRVDDVTENDIFLLTQIKEINSHIKELNAQIYEVRNQEREIKEKLSKLFEKRADLQHRLLN